MEEWEIQREAARRAAEAQEEPLELREYLRSPTVEEHVQPIEWWKLNHKVYPTLAKAAGAVLGAQAASSASERLWSWGRDVVTCRKHSMSPKMMCTALLLKSWITVIPPVKE